MSGFYTDLIALGDTPVRIIRCRVDCSTRRKGGTRQSRVVPLVHVPLDLRAGRGGPADRGAAHRAGPAIVLAMVLVGLSRCQVLGPRLADIQIADRRLPAQEICHRAAA